MEINRYIVVMVVVVLLVVVVVVVVIVYALPNWKLEISENFFNFTLQIFCRN